MTELKLTDEVIQFMGVYQDLAIHFVDMAARMRIALKSIPHRLEAKVDKRSLDFPESEDNHSVVRIIAFVPDSHYSMGLRLYDRMTRENPLRHNLLSTALHLDEK